MNTLTHSHQANVSVNAETTIINSNTEFWKNAEFNRFGIIPLLLVIIGCIGGIAVAFGAQGDAILIGAVAFPTMIALSLILAVAPMRAIFIACTITIIIDLLIFVF